MEQDTNREITLVVPEGRAVGVSKTDFLKPDS